MLEKLREELSIKFLEYGLTEETLKLSQELDVLIVKEQLKLNQNN